MRKHNMYSNNSKKTQVKDKVKLESLIYPVPSRPAPKIHAKQIPQQDHKHNIYKERCGGELYSQYLCS